MIHLEAPTHRIPSDQTGADELAGPLLTAAGDDYVLTCNADCTDTPLHSARSRACRGVRAK